MSTYHVTVPLTVVVDISYEPASKEQIIDVALDALQAALISDRTVSSYLMATEDFKVAKVRPGDDEGLDDDLIFATT